MRSVLVHLRDVTEAEVVAFLDKTFPKPESGEGWTLVAASEPVLYIGIYRDLNSEFEVEDWCALLECLGSEPAISVYADVSGRHPGDQEVRSFVTSLLTMFNGVAQDDYVNHFWRSEQITNGEIIEGHPFFDYQGVTEATRPNQSLQTDVCPPGLLRRVLFDKASAAELGPLGRTVRRAC